MRPFALRETLTTSKSTGVRKGRTMKKVRERLLVLANRVLLAAALVLVAWCAITTLAGCSNEEASGAVQPESAAFVVGAHANAPLPKSDCASDYIAKAVDTNGYIEVISAEGEPRSAVSGAIVGSTANTESKRAQENEQWKAALPGYLSDVRAQTAEVDTLASIELAARALSEAPGTHSIVVMDSGLQTSGALDFTQGALIDADASEVAAWLADNSELPDLTGIQVDWYYLGDVAAPQEDLSPAQRDNLRSIWQTILETAGAQVAFHDTTPASDAAEGLPEVSVVDLPERAAMPDSLTAGETVQVELTESDVKFQGDSAEFVDAGQARDAVADCAELMAENGNATCLVEGTTASADPTQGDEGEQFIQELSQARAAAVANLLVEAGADPDAIEARGCGDDHPSHVSDRDDAGKLIPSQAALNRKVIITISAA